MKHDLELTGHAFRLRPIELSDAQSIVDLRASQPGRGQFLHPISDDVRLQEAYLTRYFDIPEDYYFVVEVGLSLSMIIVTMESVIKVGCFVIVNTSN